MLDSDTKRRIDSCRDILVGKVPDPKSQVEQITIALIYKFMDDMDAEAEEFGGERKFFAGDFGKYGWPKLMAPNMGGFDVLALYSEAIQKMNENPGVPALFRDIFKNAYLPYRDPETLRIFLKEIDRFTYDHSERLGDAFEYLLSVLGSQGDAGQFRTPRHIIDFMVEVIDPKKDQSILDPACGTAGFLISSYKHILKHNSKDYRPQNDREAYDEKGVPLQEVTLDSPLRYKGDLLTPDDRKRLATNIKGYDISPDMVRLSLVNLYLHGFTDPHIIEYDTLTSEERWNDYADIILANPPFMSPKGGIKPHKRFSVQATRSEVLFVDYIAEHLTPTGRAAVIVPEGIIFQSGGAYKQLRETLLKNYLVAVISLPAGVFNPYSGVKTSILVMDKRLSKKTDAILFGKIENDGFNLGAQRRAIDKNDLPAAARNIKAWLDSVRNDSAFDLANIPNLHLVDKARIAENGEWNLSGERYLQSRPQTDHAYPLVRLGELCDRVSDSVDPTTLSGNVIYIGLENIESDTGKVAGQISSDYESIKSLKSAFAAGDILYGKLRPNLNKVHLAKIAGICSTDILVLRPRPNTEAHYLSSALRSPQFNAEVVKGLGGAQLPRVSSEYLSNLLLPLPPLDVQKEIVAETEGCQKIIDGARQVVENYQPRIHVEPDWPMVELEGICDNLDSKRVPITKGDRKEGSYPYYGASGIVDYVDGYIFDEDLLLISEDGANLLARSTPIAFSISGKAWVNNHAHVLRFHERATQKFVEVYINSISIDNYVTGAAQPKLNQQALNSIKIPLPELATQRAIVAQIEEEQRLVNANKELVELFDAKVKATINRVWGEAA
jgi:type I restriction enzyme M protein